MNKYSRAYTTVSAMVYFSFVARTRSTICLHSSGEVAIGTVQETCLPAFSAAMLIHP